MSARARGNDAEGYEAVARQTWHLGALDGFEGAALDKELVRYATLAPSSHNTQCWKFAAVDKAITILPDLSRRTPAVGSRGAGLIDMTQRKGTAMTWLLWLGGVFGAVIVIALGLRVVGANHWAELIRTHTSQLESGRVDVDGSAQSRLPSSARSPARFDARELEGLPAPVQRYFRAVLKEGQPMIAAATIEMAGKINMSASAEQWKPFTSHQRVVTSLNGSRPGFLWNAQVNMFPGVPARVEDSYIAGQGQLIAKLFGLFTVAEARGGGELARGEFMRYFAEAVWYPTALLPSQGVQWQAVDDASANATIVDGPITLTLLFRFNEAGLIASVRAESRGAGVGKDMVMLPWECSLSDYQSHDGMLIGMTGEVAWVRPGGRKAYFVGHVKKLSYEFSP